jgi:hypothetical protein
VAEDHGTHAEIVINQAVAIDVVQKWPLGAFLKHRISYLAGSTLSNGCMLNCEDPVTFADGALSAELRQRHPAVAERIDARRDFVRTALGIGLKQTMLPLSATPLCLPPFWLSPHKLFARA